MSGKYALIIGNTEYIDLGLAQLTAPGKDAEDFARTLQDQEICAFNDVNILLNESEAIVSETIEDFFDGKKQDDLLVLYFSGHGVRDENGSLYLAVKNTNRARLRSTAIKSDFIRDAMDQSRSKRQILILDCCNSGAFAHGTKAATGGSIGIATAFEGTGYGRVVLTASDSTQFAWDGDKVIGETSNSLFTHFLLKGLKGEADTDNNGKITVDKLYNYAYDNIVNITHQQTPRKWSFKQQGEIVLRQFTETQMERLREEQKRLEQKKLDLANAEREAANKEIIQLRAEREAVERDIQAARKKAEAERRMRKVAGFLQLSTRIWGIAIFVVMIIVLATMKFLPTLAKPTNYPAAQTVATEAVISPSETAIETVDTPSLPVEGGTDKIAFVDEGNIWIMNIDGTDLKQLTDDHGDKSDLQWLPDGETIAFISGLSVKYLNINTTSEEVKTLATFISVSSLDAFRVSYDGKWVMIVLGRKIFVVPFDFKNENLKDVHTESDLEELDGVCIKPQENTKSNYSMREVFWSADGELVAWIHKGVADNGNQVDQVSVLDIQSCNPATIDLRHIFTLNDYQLPNEVRSGDWNGKTLFVFNASERNDGWGDLYFYNLTTFKENFIRPVNDKCCYRDARWSSDGTYLFFAFQDEATNLIELYYVPFAEIGTGRTFTPLSLAEDLFKDRKASPQAALRPAQSP